jgi:hypothetical protein
MKFIQPSTEKTKDVSITFCNIEDTNLLLQRYYTTNYFPSLFCCIGHPKILQTNVVGYDVYVIFMPCTNVGANP